METEDRLVVVFSDTRPALAQLLCDRLREAGIEAFLENEALRQAAGDLPLGWPTAPRVVVVEHDLAAAREIVAEFIGEGDAVPAAAQSDEHDDQAEDEHDDPTAEDGSAAAARLMVAGSATHAPSSAAMSAACPQCGKPRLAECPFCHTAGADFAVADQSGAGSAEEEGEAALLICPTCDEPFAPGYLRRCEWCGHDFGEGIELAPAPPAEPLNNRIIAVAIALGLIIAVILAWFTVLLN